MVPNMFVTLCLWEQLWFHFITVPVPLRSVIKLRLVFRYGNKLRFLRFCNIGLYSCVCIFSEVLSLHTMAKRQNNQLPNNLPQLQNLIKRDAESYKEEFQQQFRHFQWVLALKAFLTKSAGCRFHIVLPRIVDPHWFNADPDLVLNTGFWWPKIEKKF